MVVPHDPFILLKFNGFQMLQPRQNFLDNKMETINRDRRELVSSFLKKRGLSFDTVPPSTRPDTASPFKTTYKSNASYEAKINFLS